MIQEVEYSLSMPTCGVELARRGKLGVFDFALLRRDTLDNVHEALRAACANDHVDCLQRMLSPCCAEFEVSGLSRALVSAAAWGSCGAAKCLIARDDFRQLDYGNALRAAVAGAHLEFVVLLFKAGVRADRSILHEAVASCSFGDAAWDVRARGPEARQVLYLIAENHFGLHCRLVQLDSVTAMKCRILHDLACHAANRFHSLPTVRLLIDMIQEVPPVRQRVKISDVVNGVGWQDDGDQQRLLMKAVSAYTNSNSGWLIHHTIGQRHGLGGGFGHGHLVSRKVRRTPRPHAETVKIVDYLLECRADVCATTRDGWTVLMYALRSNNEEVVHRLLQAKASTTVNARNQCRATALTMAVQWCRSNRVMAALFAANATAGRRRALSIAAARCDDGIVKLLMAAWPTVEWIQRRSASEPCPLFSMTKLSDRCPSNVRQATGMKNFAYMVAKCRRTVLTLLSAKANVNDSYDVFGSHISKNNGEGESTDEGEGKGADETEGETEGEGEGEGFSTTLLHEAAKARRAYLVKVLVDLGANVNARGSYNWTPLDSACFHNSGIKLASSHQILAIMWTRAHEAARKRAVTQAAARGKVWRLARQQFA